ncbi:MAG: alpha-L-fucosidase [Kiritimatiellia bacterium]
MKRFDTWFEDARYGMFVHYGLFSLLERGEWVMNRERLSRDEMRKLAGSFDPAAFDAEALCDLAVSAGMRYVVLTTMHHEGFRLYDTELSSFNSKAVCGRDLVEEFVQAARRRGLKTGLYHSLNNWYDSPDGSDALEDPADYEVYIEKTHARLRELVTRFNPIDVLWYDGWWPFDAHGWKAEEMNAMVRKIQPHILVNGRNGLPGDFGTPEGHMSAPQPWRPWEACMTLNDHWGYHCGDRNWKTPAEVVQLLMTAAQDRGNLLLNIGPRGDGSVPTASVDILHQVGRWLEHCGEAVYDTDPYTFGLMDRAGHNADWSHHGPFSRKGNILYQFLRYWPGAECVIAGLQATVERVTLLGAGNGEDLPFAQREDKVVISGLPEHAPDGIGPVLRLVCDGEPVMELSGGMRIPTVPHPPYDPCPSDIA